MHIYDVGVDSLHGLIPKTKSLDACHADIMDEHIGLFQQSFEHGFVLRLFDVEVNGFFIAVERSENRTMLFGGRIAAMAHHVARGVALAIFDFDYFGT